jgi:hypothetical protein
VDVEAALVIGVESRAQNLLHLQDVQEVNEAELILIFSLRQHFVVPALEVGQVLVQPIRLVDGL